jgi:hypothetical protein
LKKNKAKGNKKRSELKILNKSRQNKTKKFMKTKITLVFAILFSIYSFGQVGTIFTTGGLKYKITAATTVEVGRNSAITGAVTIPATVTYNSANYQVTSIGDLAFIACSTLTTVSISNSVTRIGVSAFQECILLSSVSIPNSVTSIGSNAFTSSTGLTSVTFGNSVTNIEFQAFQDCTALISAAIPNSVTNIADALFAGCTSLTSVSIPNSVTSISNFAFSNCSALTSVTIPNSVTSIGSNTFNNCTGLAAVTVNWTTPISINSNVFSGLNLSTRTLKVPAGTQATYDSALVWTNFNPIIEQVVAPVLNQTFALNGINYIVTKVTLPYEVAVASNSSFVGAATIPSTVSNSGNSFSVTSIGDSAFIRCIGLTTVTIPSTVTSIGYKAFENCSGLTSVSIPNSVTNIGDYTFARCIGLTSVTIPNSVTSIGYYAFELCSSLYSVNIPNSVTSIGLNAFSRCYRLDTITIPNSVTSIGGGAFSFCTNLTSITLPNSITTLNSGIFGNCSSLTSVTIPNSVTSIGQSTFNRCSSLTSIFIPNSVTSIDHGAFGNCSSLTSVTIPNSVTSIGSLAFSNCTSLTSITIPNSVTSIGEYAYTGCSSLTSITIPNSVTSISRGTFYYCTGLISVAIPNSVTSIGDEAFGYCSGLTSITIPNSVTSIAHSLFVECSGLTSITIPNTVTSIGSFAFSNCTSLTSITLPNSITTLNGATFKGCNALASVTVNWAIPIYIESSVFSGLNLTTRTLNVPAGRVAAYDAAPVWTNFGTFIEYTSILDSNFEQALFDLGIDIVNGDNQVLTSAISIITDLDVSNKGIVDLSGIRDFINLQSLTCVGNQLISLDLRGLLSLSNFNGQSNPSLSCISVDDVTFATNNYLIDATTSFSTGCFGPSIINYCKGAVATPLNAFGALGSTLKWYTVATGGMASLIAPTPSTTTVGTRNYYVAQVVAGVESARVAVTVTVNAFPTTPGAISTSDAVLCKYIGTTNEVTYTVPAVPGTTYNWSTPAGVNVIAPASATYNSITVNFLNSALNNTSVGGVGTISVSAISTVGSCASASRSLALSSKLPTAPASLTLSSPDTTPHFNLRDVDSDPATYSFVGLNALDKITKVGPYIDTETVFTLTAPPAATAASYAWTLPAGVNPIGDVTGNVITVDFAGVAPGIGVLRIAVHSVAGCGQSVTPRTINLSRALPTASSKLVLTESPSGTALTRVSPYTGKTTELTLTATPDLVQGATATSYAWILPTGVNCITPNTPTVVKQRVNTGTSTPEGAPIFEIRDFAAISTGSVSTITIDFADVVQGTLSFPLSVFAVNGAGNSKARTRTVTAAAPATPGAITTPLLAAPKFNPTCATSATIVVQVPAVAGATYAWTVAGGTERIVSGNGSNSIVVNVAGVTTTTLSVSVVASNGTGSSLPRTLAIGKTSVCSAKIALEEVSADEFSVNAYPNPSSDVFNIEASGKGAITVEVYDMQGRLIENRKTNANSIQVGSRLSSGVYNVMVKQGVNVKILRVIKK